MFVVKTKELVSFTVTAQFAPLFSNMQKKVFL